MFKGINTIEDLLKVAAYSLDKLKQDYVASNKLSEEQFDLIVSSDPTYVSDSNKPGSYTLWLLKTATTDPNLFSYTEEQIRDYLNLYKLARSSGEIKENIEKFPTFKSLVATLDPKKEELQKNFNSKQFSKKVNEAGKDPSQYEVYYNSPQWIIIIPKTVEASCYFGKGTHWCTATQNLERNMFNSYNGRGKLYIIYDKQTQQKWQYHDGSKEFRDQYDNTTPLGLMSIQLKNSNDPEINKVLANLVQKNIFLETDENKIYETIVRELYSAFSNCKSNYNSPEEQLFDFSEIKNGEQYLKIVNDYNQHIKKELEYYKNIFQTLPPAATNSVSIRFSFGEDLHEIKEKMIDAENFIKEVDQEGITLDPLINSGKFDMIEELISSKAPIRINQRLFQSAIINNNLNIINYFLSNLSKENNRIDRSNDIYIQLAIKMGNNDILKLLVNNSFKIEDTALYTLLKESNINNQIDPESNLENLKILMEHLSIYNSPDQIINYDIMQAAVSSGNPYIVSFLFDYITNKKIEFSPEEKINFMHTATGRVDLGVIDILLKNNIPVDNKDLRNIINTTYDNNIKKIVIGKLLSSGVIPDAESFSDVVRKGDYDLILEFIKHGSDMNQYSLLGVAIAGSLKETKLVYEAMKSRGIIPQDNLMEQMVYANKPDIFKYLVDQGFPVTPKQANDAIVSDRPEELKIILSKGIMPTPDMVEWLYNNNNFYKRDELRSILNDYTEKQEKMSLTQPNEKSFSGVNDLDTLINNKNIPPENNQNFVGKKNIEDLTNEENKTKEVK